LRGRPCLPRPEGRRFELPEVRVSYVVTDIGERTTARVPIAVLTGSSRLAGTNLDEPAFRADPREVPAPTYRVSPTVLAVVALSVAGLLVLVALVLLVPLVPIGFVQRWREARRARRRTDLERALAHLRATVPRGETGEVRPALERLASELGRVESGELAVQTRRLAWAEPPPVEDEIGELSTDVDDVIAEGRR
jgi:Flp pilus assembly protein TadB